MLNREVTSSPAAVSDRHDEGSPSRGLALWAMASVLALGIAPAVPGQELEVAYDRGVIWGVNGENGHHQEIGYEPTGKLFFILAQAGGGSWPGKGCPDLNPYDCVNGPGDQIELLTAASITGPWIPLGSSLKTARITPCWDEGGFAVPTTWGVGSLWEYNGTWYLTVDAGHGGDGEKHYVYLITSVGNGWSWETITEGRRIIDASGAAAHQRILYTTVIPTGGPKVGFFFWTGDGDKNPSNMGYGQIDLQPGAQDPNGVAVYLLDDQGSYRKLPENGEVDFQVMRLWKTGSGYSLGNPRPGDAYLTNGLQGQLLLHRDYDDTSVDVCHQGDGRKTRVTELSWVDFELELDSSNRPRLKLCPEVPGGPANKLCDQQPKKIGPGGAPGYPWMANPRNGVPGIIDPDVFFNPVDQKRYLLTAEEPNCDAKWGDLKIHLYELD